MTDPFDLSALTPEPADQFLIPNHKIDEPPGLFSSKPKRERKPLFGPREPASTPPPKRMPPPPEHVPNKPGQFVKPLTDMYIGFSMILMPVKPEIAMAIAQNAEQCATAWDNLAQRNEAVRRTLKRLLSTSATAELVMAHLPILMTVGMSIPAVQSMIGGKLAKEAEAHANYQSPTERPDEQRPQADASDWSPFDGSGAIPPDAVREEWDGQ